MHASPSKTSGCVLDRGSCHRMLPQEHHSNSCNGESSAEKRFHGGFTFLGPSTSVWMPIICACSEGDENSMLSLGQLCSSGIHLRQNSTCLYRLYDLLFSKVILSATAALLEERVYSSKEKDHPRTIMKEDDGLFDPISVIETESSETVQDEANTNSDELQHTEGFGGGTACTGCDRVIPSWSSSIW